jgi:hypothetical protein
MTTLTRDATIRWLTHPPEGTPHLSVGSKSIAALPLNVARHEAHTLAASPVELLGGAIGCIFALFAADALVEGATRDGDRGRLLRTMTV